MNNSVYDIGDIHRRYDRARQLPDETMRLWLGKLAPHAPDDPAALILDAGCGTGRFTLALAERHTARVYGIDASAKMLSVAAERVAAAPDAERVRLLRATAERLPLRDDSVSLALLSMVYHHLTDKDRACQELRRVLKDTGRLAVRAATREGLDTFLWHRFFPEAREIDLKRLPSEHELVARLEKHGFTLKTRESVRQLFARDLDEYCEKISLRALSSLQAIPDEAFARGLSDLRRHCAAHDDPQPVYEEIGLFVFIAKSKQA